MNLYPLEQKIYDITTSYISSYPIIKFRNITCSKLLYNKILSDMGKYKQCVDIYKMKKEEQEIMLLQIFKLKKDKNNKDEYHKLKREYNKKIRSISFIKNNINLILRDLSYSLNDKELSIENKKSTN
jgi:hypothetical protein